MELTNKCGTIDKSGNWNRFQVIQKIPEQHTVKAPNEVTTESNHIWHCTHTSGSTNTKLQKFVMGNNGTGTAS
jgi:hypothetical protein